MSHHEKEYFHDFDKESGGVVSLEIAPPEGDGETSEEVEDSGATEDGGMTEVDTTTGATPGIANACKEFGWGSSDEFVKSLGIKPAGEI